LVLPCAQNTTSLGPGRGALPVVGFGSREKTATDVREGHRRGLTGRTGGGGFRKREKSSKERRLTVQLQPFWLGSTDSNTKRMRSTKRIPKTRLKEEVFKKKKRIIKRRNKENPNSRMKLPERQERQQSEYPKCASSPPTNLGE